VSSALRCSNRSLSCTHHHHSHLHSNIIIIIRKIDKKASLHFSHALTKVARLVCYTYVFLPSLASWQVKKGQGRRSFWLSQCCEFPPVLWYSWLSDRLTSGFLQTCSNHPHSLYFVAASPIWRKRPARDSSGNQMNNVHVWHTCCLCCTASLINFCQTSRRMLPTQQHQPTTFYITEKLQHSY